MADQLRVGSGPLSTGRWPSALLVKAESCCYNTHPLFHALLRPLLPVFRYAGPCERTIKSDYLRISKNRPILFRCRCKLRDGLRQLMRFEDLGESCSLRDRQNIEVYPRGQLVDG